MPKFKAFWQISLWFLILSLIPQLTFNGFSNGRPPCWVAWTLWPQCGRRRWSAVVLWRCGRGVGLVQLICPGGFFGGQIDQQTNKTIGGFSGNTLVQSGIFRNTTKKIQKDWVRNGWIPWNGNDTVEWNGRPCFSLGLFCATLTKKWYKKAQSLNCQAFSNSKKPESCFAALSCCAVWQERTSRSIPNISQCSIAVLWSKNKHWGSTQKLVFQGLDVAKHEKHGTNPFPFFFRGTKDRNSWDFSIRLHINRFSTCSLEPHLEVMMWLATLIIGLGIFSVCFILATASQQEIQGPVAVYVYHIYIYTPSST